MERRISGVRILLVPYDSGHREARMGRGPRHLVENGLAKALRAGGHQVATEEVVLDDGFLAENGSAFALMRLLSERVREAVGREEFPLVLSGNCNATVGVVAGGRGGVGIIWFDGHADFNTPETTRSAFLDGMGLAIATGGCWSAAARTVPGFRPVPEESVVLVGARDLDPDERRRLERSRILVVEEDLRGALAPLRAGTTGVHVHLDLDVLDPDRVAPANGLAPPGGLSPGQVEEALRMIRERRSVTSATISSYDPSFDTEDRVLNAAIGLVRALVEGR